MKKSLIAVASIVVLAGGGYTASKTLSKNKTNKSNSFVQLENGQEIKVGSPEGKGELNRAGDAPDIVGKIKLIKSDSLVVEQFDMFNMGGNRDKRTASGEQVSSERPTPTVSGEVTIVLAKETSYTKGTKKGMGSGMGARGGNKNSEPEEASKGDLKEGDMLSIWTLSDEQTAERIMVR